MRKVCRLRAMAGVPIVALLLASAPVAALPAPASGAPVPPAGYTMPATQVWDMASDSGEVYRIFVSFPQEGTPPEDGYPVLYVLDGNAAFAGFAEARRVQEYAATGQSIIVGVGYPTDDAYDARRLYDYTPPLLDPPPRQWRGLAKYRSGGRKPFLDFLTGRLRAEIDRRFRTDPERNSLFGHSLGGLFALYALHQRPQAFHSIVAASPSLDWNEQGVLAEERDFVARLQAGKAGRTSRLMVVTGGRDTEDDPQPAHAMVERLDRLSGYGLRVRLRDYPDEVHVSVPSRSVTDVLRFAFEIR